MHVHTIGNEIIELVLIWVADDFLYVDLCGMALLDDRFARVLVPGLKPIVAPLEPRFLAVARLRAPFDAALVSIAEDTRHVDVHCLRPGHDVLDVLHSSQDHVLVRDVARRGASIRRRPPRVVCQGRDARHRRHDLASFLVANDDMESANIGYVGSEFLHRHGRPPRAAGSSTETCGRKS